MSALVNQLPAEQAPHIAAIVDQIKSQGIFDTLRKECLADVDTKPAYQNLRQKVENACASFLSRIIWSAKLNKIQLREQMRKNLEDSGVLQSGVKRIANQVLTPKIDKELKPMVAQFVCEHLGVNPDDIHTGEEEELEGSQPEVPNEPVTLYPFNPLEPPPTTTTVNGQPPLPGFDESEELSAHGKETVTELSAVQEVRFEEPQLVKEGAAKQDDMDISDRSDSRSTSRASTKKSIDMDCTMTSDEEADEGKAGVDGADLTKGLAAYMGNLLAVNKSDSDNMSISSSSNSEISSKQGKITPEPSQDTKDIPGVKKTSKSLSTERAFPERREMRRNRTRNKKYMSEDFESIFTEKKDLLSDAYNQDYVEEEIVTADDMMSQVVLEEMAAEPLKEPDGDRPDSPGTSEKSSKLNKDTSLSLRLSKSNSEIPANLPQQKHNHSKQFPSESSESVAEAIAPQRCTRSTAKGLAGSPLVDQSPGSTPVKDEQMDGELVMPMVVLSDICALQSRLLPPSPTERSEVTEQHKLTEDVGVNAVSAANILQPTTNEPITEQTWSPDEQLTDSYEPELHFDEMSKVVKEETSQSRSTSANDMTPTMDERHSPDRLTDSPTSPTPSSPTDPSAYSSLPNTSIITIPLEEDNFCQSIPLPVQSNISTFPTAEQPPLPPELPPLPGECSAVAGALLPPEPELEEEEGAEDEDAVYHVVDEVGADEGDSFSQNEEEAVDFEEQSLENEYEEEDLEELERLAQRKLEILKAIELPDSVLEKTGEIVDSSEEGEISDSSEDERSRSKKKKSKKSKKKKSKKESRKRKYRDADHDMGNLFKRSKYS